MKTRKGVTLIEVILTIVLSGILLLGASQLIVSGTQFFTTLQTGISLSQEANVVLEHISKNIRNSKYVQIDNVADSLTLYNASNAIIGTYTWSGTNLNYTPQGQSAALVSNKIDPVNSITLSDPFIPSNTQTKVLQIVVNTKDPKFQSVGPKSGATTAYCRLPGVPTPVRLVSSSLTVKGLYATIQSAITAASNGDIVQVSSNDGASYAGNIRIQDKSITLNGGYNYKDWTRHTNEPYYETIIDAKSSNPAVLYNFTVACNNTIDGFTVMGGGGSFYPGGVYIQNTVTGCSFAINNNIIKQNMTGINAPYLNPGPTVNITNNTIQGNTAGGIALGSGATGPGSYTATIQKNNITGNSVTTASQVAYYAGGICCVTASGTTLNIINNAITNNSLITTNPPYAYSGGGIEIMKQAFAAVTVANNNISQNTVSGTAGYGGGITIYTEKQEMSGGSGVALALSNNIISSNTISATNGYGGGAYVCIRGGNLSSQLSKIKNNTITGNTINGLGYGGGLYASAAGGCSLEASNNTISQNTTTGGCAGAGLCSFLGLSVINNTITENISSGGSGGSGGGIQAGTADVTYSGVDIKNNIIRGNSITGNNSAGGGIRGRSNTGAINNNIITNNNADNAGGGIYLSMYSNLTPTNNTIYGNGGSSVTGGGIFANMASGVTLTILNSIIYNNTASNIYPGTASGTIVANYSDIGGTGGTYSGTGTGNKNIAPVFTNLATYDYHLQDVTGNNSIIDGGNSSSTYNDVIPPGLRTARNDMGAYGGPGATTVIGFNSALLVDDSGTPLIREDIIGTY